MNSSLSESTAQAHQEESTNGRAAHGHTLTPNGAAKDQLVVNGHHDELTDDSEHGKAVPEKIYWAHYYQHPYRSYEWNNGILEEKGMSDREQLNLHDWFFSILREYLKAFPIAYYIYLETGIRFALPHKVSIRKPDLFVIRNDNPMQYEMPDRTYHGICDLAIESLSDSTQSEIDRDTIVKKQEYAIAGVQEYYILDVRHGHTNFYQLDADNHYQPLQPQDGVIHSQVLPGFQFRLEHLTSQPYLIELINDPVYQEYVMLDYQEQLRMTEAARQEATKAKQEALAAQQEALVAQQEALVAQQEALVAQQEALVSKQETERLAAKLRQLGIDPSQL